MTSGRNSPASICFSCGRDDQREFGLVEDVGLQLDAGRDLGDDDAFGRQLHHAALGHVGHVLALHHAAPPGEGDLLHLLHQLLHLAFLLDPEPALDDLHAWRRR